MRRELKSMSIFRRQMLTKQVIIFFFTKNIAFSYESVD